VVTHVHDHMLAVGLFNQYRKGIWNEDEYEYNHHNEENIICRCLYGYIFTKSAEASDLHRRFFHQRQWTLRLSKFGSALEQWKCTGFESKELERNDLWVRHCHENPLVHEYSLAGKALKKKTKV
jgi:hypothetical protein